jgi:hypothetical protein
MARRTVTRRRHRTEYPAATLLGGSLSLARPADPLAVLTVEAADRTPVASTLIEASPVAPVEFSGVFGVNGEASTLLPGSLPVHAEAAGASAAASAPLCRAVSGARVCGEPIEPSEWNPGYYQHIRAPRYPHYPSPLQVPVSPPPSSASSNVGVSPHARRGAALLEAEAAPLIAARSEAPLWGRDQESGPTARPEGTPL